MLRRVALWVAPLLLAGCTSTPADPDAPPDVPGLDGPADARTEICVGDDQCSDGNFCNGRERCEPTSGTADERGCVPSRGRPCLEAQACDEMTDECVTDCGDSRDADGDGEPAVVCGGRDCDDADSLAYPGATEVCDDEDQDEDCDPTTFGRRDLDRDGSVSEACCNVSSTGVRSCGDDCNDALRGVRPTATETCNERDDDCNGATDEGATVPGFADRDRDLHGDPGMPGPVCPAELGTSTLADDCDDGSVAAHRAQVEICDDADNDCDGETDEHARAVTWYRDDDGDGFGSAASGTMVSCAPLMGYSLLPTDCDDGNRAVSPLAAEACDGLDSDCDGNLNGIFAPGDFEDDDGDGHLDAACGGDDCDDLDWDAYAGAPEICDFRDSDCDGLADLGATPPMGAVVDATVEVDWFADVDLDGWGAGTPVRACTPPPGRTTRGGDCDDEDPTAHPGVADRCDGFDDDCDTLVDEDAAARAFYADGDGDGDGTGAAALACRLPPGLTELPGDCADADARRGPSAFERCDGLDDDCDGDIDEELFRDTDGDGHGDPGAPVTGGCMPGDVGLADDCDDGDPAVGMSGTCAELCNGRDDDRDGMTDEGAEASCPNASTTTWACPTGRCELVGCRGMAADCDAVAANGCERDTATDPAACGDCVTTCGVGAACAAGVCDDPVVDIACGEHSTMALRRSGTSVFWGVGGAAEAASVPAPGGTPIPALTEVRGASALVVGRFRGCAESGGTGAYECWGTVGAGGIPAAVSLLGDGRTETVAVPTPLSAGPFDALSVGLYHACGVRPTGQVLCWGGPVGTGLPSSVPFDALGDGTGVGSATPVTVLGLGDATGIAASELSTCAVRSTGHVICWGANGAGILATGGFVDRSLPTDEVELAGGAPLTGVTSVAMGRAGTHACARRSDGTAWCWGTNNTNTLLGLLGIDAATMVHEAFPYAVNVVSGPGSTAPLTGVVRVEVGNQFTLALLESGALVCWGSGVYGQCGNGGTVEAVAAPVPVSLPPLVADFCAGGNHACALLGDGRVMCWGLNDGFAAGQDTTTRFILVPTEVSGLSGP